MNKSMSGNKGATDSIAFHCACQMLHRLGITINYAGFYQTAYGLARAAQDPGLLQALRKELYPQIALQYNTGASCVEHNIRTIRILIWKKHRKALFAELGHPLARCPGNARFLAYLTACLMEELGSSGK